MHRSCSCGALTLEDQGKPVTLAGWVHRRRDLGGLIFIDLRDREGITQVVFDSNRNPSLHKLAQALNREYVLRISGHVVKRTRGTENPKIPTGQIEVAAETLEILNPCTANLPITRLDEEGERFLPSEEVRLKYRYLDLRRKRMFENLKLRHRVVKAIRDFLDREGFLEVETPMLIRTTPEGARDYLVPSRLHPGKFYALPQSPQLFKQLLMVAGFEKYFQIARCMRDEDLRADRQPEFTQLDLEMSFVEREDLFSLLERLFQYVFKTTLGVEIPIPFERLSYQEAMESYGTDKPDLRFGMPVLDLTRLFSRTGFKIFQDVIASGGAVKAIHVKGGGKFFSSRTRLEAVVEKAKLQGLKGLTYLAWTEAGAFTSPLARHLENEKTSLAGELKAEAGDITFLFAGDRGMASEFLGKLRVQIAGEMNLIPQDQFAFLWVIDFPMFQWNEEEKRLEPMHHPFTSPLPEDISLLDTDPLKVRANAYDIVLNGYEIASGSIRIHQRPLQEKIFQRIGLSTSEAEQKFGFLLEAFQYGAPPHGGIAPGIDRLVMIMAGAESIREVIAFPKNQSAQDLMLGAPVEASEKQLKELFLKCAPLSPPGPPETHESKAARHIQA